MNPEEAAKRQRLDDASAGSASSASNSDTWNSQQIGAGVMRLLTACKANAAYVQQVRDRWPTLTRDQQLKWYHQLRDRVQQNVAAKRAVTQQQQNQQQQLASSLAKAAVPVNASPELIEQERQRQEAERLRQEKRLEEERERLQLEEDGIVLDTDPVSTDLLEQEAIEVEEDQAKEVVFAQYHPRKVSFGREHKDPIVESAAMASVEPPDTTYVPSLPYSLLRGEEGTGDTPHAQGALSMAQLETVVYAGQRHAQTNADGSRSGFFLGDGTGVGKGRQIAAVVLDNYNKGKARHIWCSISTALFHDARRDLDDLGRADVPLHDLARKLKQGEEPPGDGVMYCTYQLLIARSRGGDARIDQLIAWAAEMTDSGDPADFDGVLAFDEAHRAKNLKASDAKAKGAKTADAVLELQLRLPNARVLYVSATAAAETSHLGYMIRLGLWGAGTPFRDFDTFARDISKAGVGAMELLAMDMKARGLFVARMLAFTGCEFDERTCVLSREERALYDQAVAWWDDLRKGFEDCIKLTGVEDRASRMFWRSHQDFFKQLLNSLKCRFAIEEAEAALDRGECVVIGLLSTGEAKANEAIERGDLGREVSTPQAIAKDMLERHLPVERPGSDGAPGMVVPEALLRKEQLEYSLDEIRMPGNALDLLISHFGVDEVAEMTGRKKRIVTYNGRSWPEVREEDNNEEKKAFLDGRKRVAVISEAASSGISLHADSRFENQARRTHITLELPWQADKMLQQFGRTHRSNQVCAPRYLMLTTDVGGEQRFSSSVARKLESLGAMTRGDRRGGHGAAADLVTHNLDTEHGHAALALMFDAVVEQASRERLWERALKMLKCHHDGVPSLLGLSLIGLVQEYVEANDALARCSGSPATRAERQRFADAQRRAQKANRDVKQRLQQQLSRLYPYVSKLLEWAQPRIAQQANSSRGGSLERKKFGACPKSPTMHGLSWIQAHEALIKMDVLSLENDRHNINKFLNRLLGLPVATQNALFAYFLSVFRWVVSSAKARGEGENAVGVISGEAVQIADDPEVVFRDPTSSAASLIYSVKVDSGLSWGSARDELQKALKIPQVKPTQLGGTTGFWKQARSNRVVLAIELPATHTDRRHRVHRLLRPTLHPSAKAQYVPAALLRERYVCIRHEEEAKLLWEDAHVEADSSRQQDVRLLCGAIMPVWPALKAAVSRTSQRESALQVKKVSINGASLIGVTMTEKSVESLQQLLKEREGGREEDIAEAMRSRDEYRSKAEAQAAERAKLARTRKRALDAGSGKGDYAAGAGLEEQQGGEPSSEEDDEEEGPELSFANHERAASGDDTLATTLAQDEEDDADDLMDLLGE